MVDGWNAWFFEGNLEQSWPFLGQNKMSVSQLWIGFLQYYAGDFDDKNLVVCTRRLKPLTKFEKMWNSPCIAIEDPFDLSHNLGAGISRRSKFSHFFLKFYKIFSEIKIYFKILAIKVLKVTKKPIFIEIMHQKDLPKTNI